LQSPGGGDDAVGECTLDGGLRVEVAEEFSLEFVVFFLAFAGDDGLLAGESMTDAVEAGFGGVFGSGGVLRVGSVGGEFGHMSIPVFIVGMGFQMRSM
jgi:hypothetical protein